MILKVPSIHCYHHLTTSVPIGNKALDEEKKNILDICAQLSRKHVEVQTGGDKDESIIQDESMITEAVGDIVFEFFNDEWNYM